MKKNTGKMTPDQAMTCSQPPATERQKRAIIMKALGEAK